MRSRRWVSSEKSWLGSQYDAARLCEETGRESAVRRLELNA